MIGFKAYTTFKALQLHYNPKVDYDFVKYNGKTKLSQETFKKDSKRWFFQSLEKDYPTQKELVKYLFPIFNKGGWVNAKLINRNVLNKLNKDFYQKLSDYDVDKQLNNLLKYMNNLKIESSDLFKVINNYPALYECYQDGYIEYETIEYINCSIVEFNESMSDDIVFWPEEVNRLRLNMNMLRLFVLEDKFKSEFKNKFVFKIIQG